MRKLVMIPIASLVSMTCYGQLRQTSIADADRNKSAEFVIRKLLIEPQLNRSKYIFEADTVVVALTTHGADGVYRFGRGHGSHMRSNYVMVVKRENQLLTATAVGSKSQHRRLLRAYLSKRADIPRSEQEQLKMQVLKLVEINRRQAFTNVF